MQRLTADRPAYPSTLGDEEEELLRNRPGYAGRSGPKPVGFGLSGGGIRSATFCLGVFQALAGLGLLTDIDYLSSVSGGSYCASFYGRLFTREDVKSIDQVAGILSPNESEPLDGGKNRWMQLAFRWLRENGRYLSPHGAGDLLLNLAVIVRNLLSVQIVIAIFAMTLLLVAQLIRAEVQRLSQGAAWHWYYQQFYDKLPLKGYLWWSPYLLPGFALFVLFAIPAGWAYWWFANQKAPGPLLASWPRLRRPLQLVFSGWFLIPVLALRFAVPMVLSPEPRSPAYLWAVVAALVSVITLAWALIYAVYSFGTGAQSAAKGAAGQNITPSDIAGNLLSHALKVALVASFSVIGFALIDTLGQTAYAEGVATNWKWLVPLAGPLALAVPLAPYVQWAFARLNGAARGRGVSIPISIVAGIGAAALTIPPLILLDCLSHAVAYGNGTPVIPAELRSVAEQEVHCVAKTTGKGLSVSCADPSGKSLTGEVALTGKPAAMTLMASAQSKPESDAGTGSAAKDARAGPVRMKLCPIVLGFAIAILLSFFVGRSRRFLNGSSLHEIYTTRLVRAYLGASNADRFGGLGKPVTEVVPEDDIAQEEYWKGTAGLNGGCAPASDRTGSISRSTWASSISSESRNVYRKGAPLHLLNVTVNETYGGSSGLEQHDRKGLGMAIGPCGISAAVKHHVVFTSIAGNVPPARRWQFWRWRQFRAQGLPQQFRGATIFPLRGQDEGVQQRFRVFDYGDNVCNYEGQRLALGSWTAISGAAFSTGLGFRTSTALSLLAGFFNVRLGYWWDSGITRWPRPAGTWLGSLLDRMLRVLFPVQRQLLNEYLSRFPGTSERYWYLSDGGHFENMGGYELIRRRLPLIVIVDAECDASYTYEGLANLVEKARLDFSAEIEFCDEETLDTKLGKDTTVRRMFGTLEQLRRGVWAQEPVSDPATRQKRLSLAPVDSERFSLAHAALAKITYMTEGNLAEKIGWLILIKPALTGDEPADVLHYHNQHPSFPHETTLDQWFDEPQWESYRKLGEHIGLKIFGSFPKPGFPDLNAPARAATPHYGC